MNQLAPLDGTQRQKLFEAISVGFNDFGLLENLLRNYDLPTNNVAPGALAVRIYSLIDVAFAEGWLGKLCAAIAKEREGKEDVREAVLAVQQWLIDMHSRGQADPRKITIVLSSIGTDTAWKRNFLEAGGFRESLQPCEIIDTLERSKESKDNITGILREIEDAKVFVAFLSKRYIAFTQTVNEARGALKCLRVAANPRAPRRKLLAVALDQVGLDWFKREKTENGDLYDDLIVEEAFFEGKERKAIVAGQVVDDAVASRIVEIGDKLRVYLDAPFHSPTEPEKPLKLLKALVGEPVEPDNVSAPIAGTVVILGESKNASAQDAVIAADELAKELTNRGVDFDRWNDGWREVRRKVDDLNDHPIFVRTIIDSRQTNAADIFSRLSSELNVSFGFQFDDEGEKVHVIADRPKVLWRPNGPNWAPAHKGPVLFSSGDRAAEFAQWLARQIGVELTTSNAIVRYEDPVDKGDIDNPIRREAVEESLLGAISEPPLFPDSLPFGYQQLQEVIDSLRDDPNKLTVIAAHDLRSIPNSEEDTLQRFRDIDRRIEESLASKKSEKTSLMRVAVLLRNWQLFPALEFSRNSRVNKWQLLRIFKRPDGRLVADEANVARLREYAADLFSRRRQSAL